jgi:zinc-binding alcohol dehydrogenase/oxidoreductase
MKGIILEKAKGPLLPAELDKPQPGEGQVLVKLHAAALNHRDLWIRNGTYPTTSYPCILGSDGAGTVEEAGQQADPSWVGKPVVINPSLFWGVDRIGQGKQFQILGVPTQGTFAEYICVPEANVHHIPEGYNYGQAAALPLGGLTAYRALFYRGGLKPFEKLLITGIGGGVAGFLLAFGVKARARVYVTSSSDDKILRAIALGAGKGVNYTSEDWENQLLDLEPEGFDLVVDSAGGSNFPALLRLLRPGGRIVTFGATAGPIPEVSPRQVFYKQASILGSTMGSPVDFESMLDFISEHNVRPMIDKVFDLEQADEAFRHMEQEQRFGKVVLSIGGQAGQRPETPSDNDQ